MDRKFSGSIAHRSLINGSALIPLFFLVWVAAILWSSAHHVAWRDEFQSWLVAVQTQSWSEFWHAIAHERTPPLLYLVQRAIGLFPFSSVAETEWGLRLSTLPFTLGFGWIWFFKLRGLSPIERILVPFSVFIFREYGVISRCYALGLFFSAGAVWAHQTRNLFWCVVALLMASLTHTIWFLVAYGLLAWILWDEWGRVSWSTLSKSTRFWSGFGLVVLTSLVLIANQIPPSDSAFTKGFTGNLPEFFSRSFGALARAFLPLELGHPYRWNYGPFFRFGHGLAVALVLLFFLKSLGVNRFRFFSVIFAPLLVFGGVHTAAHRQAGILWIVLWWVALFFPSDLSQANRQGRRWLLAILPLVSTGIWLAHWQPWRAEPLVEYSGARDVATWAKDYGQGQKISWLVDGSSSSYFSIMGRLGVPMLEIRHNRWLKYPYFVELSRWNWVDVCRARARELVELKKDGIVLAVFESGGAPPLECGESALVYSTQRPQLANESFQVYRLW